MTPTQQAQAAHNSAALAEVYAVKDAASYLTKRRRLAGTHTPAARRVAIDHAARIMREAFDVAARLRAQAGPLPSPFGETVPGIVVRTDDQLEPGTAELRSSDGVVLGRITGIDELEEAMAR